MSSTVDSAAIKAKEVAVEDFNKAKELAHSAAKSGAYLYPIRGIFYFISHRSLWKPLLSRLMPTVSLYLGVTIFMFVVAYLPQLAVLIFVNGPLAAFTTILLTLSESSTLSTVLAKTFLIQDALVDTFDGTLLAKNEAGIVSEGRQLKSGSDPIAKLGKLLKSPFEKLTPKALVRYVMYLPLNFIPVVGTVMFVFIQGRARGKSAHTRYFQLKKMSKSEQQAWLHENAGPYTSFGLVATLLELVPIASILFSFTNTVGAALWAADIEAASSPVDLRMTNINTTAPKLREAANSANKS